MQSPLIGLVGFSPFVSNTVPNPLMLVYAALYPGAALALALRHFGRRDL